MIERTTVTLVIMGIVISAVALYFALRVYGLSTEQAGSWESSYLEAVLIGAQWALLVKR
jgi:hypothetical protein